MVGRASHKPYMNERELIQFLRSSREVRLADAVKARGRESLVVLMRSDPVGGCEPQREGSFFSFFPAHRLVSAGLVAGLVLFIGGGGVSLAAEKSLPGDALYAFKKNVNERVTRTLALTPQAQAQWEISLTARRIGEADRLNALGRLNAQTRMDLEDKATEYVARVNAFVQTLDAKHQAEKAGEVERRLNQVLESGRTIQAETVKNQVVITDRQSGTVEAESGNAVQRTGTDRQTTDGADATVGNDGTSQRGGNASEASDQGNAAWLKTSGSDASRKTTGGNVTDTSSSRNTETGSGASASTTDQNRSGNAGAERNGGSSGGNGANR